MTIKSNVVQISGQNDGDVDKGEIGSQYDQNQRPEQQAPQAPHLAAQILQQKAKFFIGKNPVHHVGKAKNADDFNQDTPIQTNSEPHPALNSDLNSGDNVGADSGAQSSAQASTISSILAPVVWSGEGAGSQDQTKENQDAQLGARAFKIAQASHAKHRAAKWLQVAQYTAVFITVAWVSYAAIYVLSLPGSAQNMINSPLTLGGIVASILAPVAMMWLCLSSWQRRNDALNYAHEMRAELRHLIMPGDAQSQLLGAELQTLIQQAMEISATSRASVKALQRARMGLREEIRELGSVSEQTEAHIERLSEGLGARAEEILSLSEILEKQSDLLNEKAAEGIETWENISAEIAEISEEVGEMFDTRAQKLSACGQTLRGHMDGLDGSLGVIVNKIDNVTRDLMVSGENLEKHTKQPLESLSHMVKNLEDQSIEVDDRLAVRIAELDQLRGKIQGSGENLAANLAAQLETAHNFAAQIEGQSRAISEDVSAQLNRHSNAIGQVMTQMETNHETMNAHMTRHQENLKHLVSEADTQISTLGEQLEIKAEGVILRAANIHGELADIENSITQHLSIIENAGMKTVESLNGQLERTKDLSAQILPHYAQMQERAQNLEVKFDQVQRDYSEKINSIFAEIEQLRSSFDKTMNDLQSGAELGQKTLSQYSEQLSETNNLFKCESRESVENLARMQNLVGGKIDDLHLVTDQVRSKFDGLQEDLNRYAADISAKLQQSRSELESVQGSFQDSLAQTAGEFDRHIDATTQKLAQSQKSYADESQRVSDLAEQTLNYAADMMDSAQLRAEKLVATVREALGDGLGQSLEGLQESADLIASKAMEIDAQLQSCLTNSGHYAQNLREDMIELSATSAQVAEDMMSAGSKLGEQMHSLVTSSQLVRKNIVQAGDKLSEDSSRMMAVTNKAVQAADEAGNIFGKNSVQLYRVVQDIVDQAKKLKDTQLRSEREAFLSSSKFVIESLYSLAVDVSRHLEDEIDQRTLRAYQKGDVAAFTHHLIEIAHKIPVEKSQQKFIDDVDFRTYVLRFIRQYEEIVDHAQSSDSGELLSSLFQTSDVGKLYKILCMIAGRNAKIH